VLVLIVIRGVHVLLHAAGPAVQAPSIAPSRCGGLPRRPPGPDLAVGLEGFDHHLPLGLVLPEVSEEPFLVGVVFAYALQAALYEPIDVGRVEGQTQVEDLPVVAVVVADGRPSIEAAFPSPTG
jgi:hypothetical protein